MAREDDEIKVVVLEADELWSYVGSKKNPVKHRTLRGLTARLDSDVLDL